jgi:hypothetical protein
MSLIVENQRYKKIFGEKYYDLKELINFLKNINDGKGYYIRFVDKTHNTVLNRKYTHTNTNGVYCYQLDYYLPSLLPKIIEPNITNSDFLNICKRHFPYIPSIVNNIIIYKLDENKLIILDNKKSTPKNEQILKKILSFGKITPGLTDTLKRRFNITNLNEIYYLDNYNFWVVIWLIGHDLGYQLYGNENKAIVIFFRLNIFGFRDNGNNVIFSSEANQTVFFNPKIKEKEYFFKINNEIILKHINKDFLRVVKRVENNFLYNIIDKRINKPVFKIFLNNILLIDNNDKYIIGYYNNDDCFLYDLYKGKILFSANKISKIYTSDNNIFKVVKNELYNIFNVDSENFLIPDWVNRDQFSYYYDILMQQMLV